MMSSCEIRRGQSDEFAYLIGESKKTARYCPLLLEAAVMTRGCVPRFLDYQTGDSASSI